MPHDVGSSSRIQVALLVLTSRHRAWHGDHPGHRTEPGPSLCLPASNLVAAGNNHASRRPGWKDLEVSLWPNCHGFLLRVLPNPL